MNREQAIQLADALLDAVKRRQEADEYPNCSATQRADRHAFDELVTRLMEI